MNRFTTYLNDLSLRAYTRLQVFAATEPVRLRGLLVSLVTAGAFLVPALADQDVAQTLASIGVVALPILVGESTRDRVSPSA